MHQDLDGIHADCRGLFNSFAHVRFLPMVVSTGNNRMKSTMSLKDLPALANVPDAASRSTVRDLEAQNPVVPTCVLLKRRFGGVVAGF